MKKADIINYPNITTRGPYGSHAVMLESDVFDKMIAVEIKVITYQDEIKLEIDTYMNMNSYFSNNAVMCDPSGTILGKPT